MTVWSATQVPHYLHRELARVLDLPAHRIRVIQPPVGGAFGGKSEPFDLEFVVAAFALRTGRPVALTYCREEVFYAHRGRHPMDMRYRSAWSSDGRMRAVDARTLIDGGAYSSFGLVTTYYSGQLASSPYELAAYRFDSTRVITNKPACDPKRWGTSRGRVVLAERSALDREDASQSVPIAEAFEWAETDNASLGAAAPHRRGGHPRSAVGGARGRRALPEPGCRLRRGGEPTDSQSVDFPLVSVALLFDLGAQGVIEGSHVVAGALAAKSRRVAIPDAVRGRSVDDPEVASWVADAAFAQWQPLANLPYDPAYRRKLVRVLTRRAMTALSRPTPEMPR